VRNPSARAEAFVREGARIKKEGPAQTSEFFLAPMSDTSIAGAAAVVAGQDDDIRTLIRLKEKELHDIKCVLQQSAQGMKGRR
jgi:hypothetical protein